MICSNYWSKLLFVPFLLLACSDDSELNTVDTIIEPEKIKTQGGKGEVELWLGYIDVGSITVALVSPLATVKTKHCWLSLTGFVPQKSGEEFFQAFKEVLETAR